MARCVDVDAGREELEPPGYGKGKASYRVAWTGLSADTGGVRGRASLTGRDTVRREAGELPALCGHGSHGASTSVFRHGARVLSRGGSYPWNVYFWIS